jgi:protein required for attachment to host cells
MQHMSDYCVVVADGARARFFALEEAEYPELESSPKLVEQDLDLANPEKELPGGELFSSAKTGRNRAADGGAHGYDDHRANHVDETDRRFAKLLTEQAASMVHTQRAKRLVVVAHSRILGLIRDTLDPLLKTGVQLQEVAKDVTKLPVNEIHDLLAKENALPRRKRPGT